MKTPRPSFEYKPAPRIDTVPAPQRPTAREPNEQLIHERRPPQASEPEPEETRPRPRPRPEEEEVEEPPDPAGGDDSCPGPVVIYCHCCHLPWHLCHHGFHYVTPICWWYYDYDPCYWEHTVFRKHWITTINEYYYDSVDIAPDIYMPPAAMLDPASESLGYLETGTDQFRSGQYMAALESFRLATLLDPDFAIPRFAYAHALFSVGLYFNAASEIYLGLTLMPEWLDVGGDIRLMYGNEADFTHQVERLLARLREWPDDLGSILVLGYVSFFSGDLYMAEKAFLKLAATGTCSDLYVAGLFMDAIQGIKQGLAEKDPDSVLTEEDSLTLDELIQR